MMFKDTLFYKCPFCRQGDITIIKFLGQTSFRQKKTATFGSAVIKRRSSDTFIVDTKTCPVCGKSSEEMQKKLEEENLLG